METEGDFTYGRINICSSFYGMHLVPTRYVVLSGYSYTVSKTSLRVHERELE
jgi:hypothetical protein